MRDGAMKTHVWKISLLVVAYVLSGCGPLLDVAITGPGKSATAEDTGFFQSYDGLVATRDPTYPNLPDLYYVSPQARITTYTIVVVPDFTSMTPNIQKLTGLQVRQYKTIKQDLPDQLATTFDGSAFRRVSRMADRIDPKDPTVLRKVPADAILMGNIKELVSVGGENQAGLTAIQVEYKLVDVKTGEEVLKAIHRSTTDLDKVPMAQARVLTGLLIKAKSVKAAARQ
jgi:hypothetical protein